MKHFCLSLIFLFSFVKSITSFQSISVSTQSSSNSFFQNSPDLLSKRDSSNFLLKNTWRYSQPYYHIRRQQQRLHKKQKPTIQQQQYENNLNVYNHKFITPSNNIPRRRMKVLLKNYYTPTLFVQVKREVNKASQSRIEEQPVSHFPKGGEVLNPPTLEEDGSLTINHNGIESFVDLSKVNEQEKKCG